LEKLVIYKNGEPVSLSYELVPIYNLEIIKEQQKLIEEKEQRIKVLEERLNRIESILELN
jgi:hypothetical protein